VIRRATRIQIHLECVREFEPVPGKQRVMCDVDWVGDAVHRDGIVHDLGSRRVVDRDDVMPSVWGKRLETYACRFPMFGRVVKHAPGLAVVVSLPSVVVGVSLGVLLTLEFKSLRCAGILPWNVKVELIA